MTFRSKPIRLSRWTAGLLVVGLVGTGLFAWQHRAGSEPGADAPHTPRQQSPVVPAQAAAPAPAQAPPWPAAPDEPPLNVQVERLLATRNPHDAYRAYRLVADCASFNLNHDRIIFDQEELKHWKGDSLPGFRGMTEDEKRHDAKLCSGLTERERQSRLDYLAIAVQAGVPGAAVDFALEGPFGDPSALQTRPGDPLVQAWKATASSQLTRAAESGTDQAALMYLASQYAGDSALLDKNPLLAYRYQIASNLITADMVGPANPLAKTLADQRAAAAGMLQDASPEQREAELAAARHIADLAKAQREQARRQETQQRGAGR